MSKTLASGSTYPSIKGAVASFFKDFDFGEHGTSTRRSYRSGANAFLRFIEDQEKLAQEDPLGKLPSSIAADFNAWMQTAEHTGPGLSSEGANEEVEEGYSPSTRRLYLHALKRLLRFWWYRDWLSFSPEDETRARRALQIQRGKEDRQRVHSRNEEVPTDFGDRMIDAATSLPLPTEEDLPDPQQRRALRLKTLRVRALVHTLRATALRVGDLCELTKEDVDLARRTCGHLRIEMHKTSLAAHVVLGDACLAAITAYLKERNDVSPWLFIQHGRTGAPPRGRRLTTEAYRRRRRGYGAQLGSGSIRSIVMRLAKRAGYKPEKDQFVSTHAFRHWHAQRLIDLGASIDQVQSVLGHARAQTTKEVYAPEPNVPEILRWESKIQR